MFAGPDRQSNGTPRTRPSIDNCRTRFWYRQSPERMVVYDFFHSGKHLGPYSSEFSNGRITKESPAWDVGGMIGVELDLHGKLVWFRCVPDAIDVSPQTVDESSWFVWFSEELTGIDLQELSPIDWPIVPTDFASDLRAWEGTNKAGLKVQVLAAANQGQPTYFEVIDKYRVALAGQVVFGNAAAPEGLLIILAQLVGLVLAFSNLISGRGDRQGTWRLMLFAFSSAMIIWLCSGGHVSSVAEYKVFVIGLATALYVATLLGGSYMALEPFVRRHWPKVFVGWTRLLSGRFMDARVGTELLIGIMCGVLVTVIRTGLFWKYGIYESLLMPSDLLSNLAGAISTPLASLEFSLVGLTAIVIIKLIVRNKVLTVVLAIAILAPILCVSDVLPIQAWPLRMIPTVITILALVRFGFLVFVGMFFSQIWLYGFLSIHSSVAAYQEQAILGFIVVLLLSVYAVIAATGRLRPYREL